MRNCPTKPKLSYGISSASARSSPRSSIPILCPLCPKPEPAVWRYNAKYHFGLAHPNADPKKYNHLWDISNFEIQEMKKKWADRHHVPVKRARKLKSAPLVIYNAHRSQNSTNREVSSNCNSLKSGRNLKCPKGKEPERVSDEDEVDSDEELKEDQSSSEPNLDSEELVGSAETSHFPKDTELELDSQRLSARKC